MKHPSAAELGVFISETQELATPSDPAEGPLSGLAFAAKDNIDALGFATTAGTPALIGHHPREDAPLVSTLRDAGARLVGKTNMHELSLGVTSNNSHFGPVRNPFDPSRIAGGSSGGSAAACALGLVDFALGTDTGGSVRDPASCCGVFGFRPSSGRYPMQGIVGLSHTRDTAGVIAPAINTITRVDGVITGDTERPESPSTLTIGLPKYFWSGLDTDLEQRALAYLEQLRLAGHRLVWIERPDIFEKSSEVAHGIVLSEILSEIDRYLKYSQSDITVASLVEQVGSPDVRAVLDGISAQPPSEQDYADALAELPMMRTKLDELFDTEELDLLLFPTLPMYAPPVGDDDTTLINGIPVPVFSTSVRNTELATILGTPSISIPIQTDGPQFGMTLEVRAGADRLLLSMVETLVAQSPQLYHLAVE